MADMKKIFNVNRMFTDSYVDATSGTIDLDSLADDTLCTQDDDLESNCSKLHAKAISLMGKYVTD